MRNEPIVSIGRRVLATGFPALALELALVAAVFLAGVYTGVRL